MTTEQVHRRQKRGGDSLWLNLLSIGIAVGISVAGSAFLIGDMAAKITTLKEQFDSERDHWSDAYDSQIRFNGQMRETRGQLSAQMMSLQTQVNRINSVLDKIRDQADAGEISGEVPWADRLTSKESEIAEGGE